MAFSDKLISWYADNGRRLPWRGIDNPYYIWLSEIILQQTRIEQGLQYYNLFISQYPTVVDLARTSEQQVLKSWQGLGYYSRARNLHAAARHIAFDLDGRFPDTYHDIIALKGVGRYTAAAIASFAFRLPYPVIDGNVYRFVSRLYGIDVPINTAAAYDTFEAVLLRLMDKGRPDLFNQALMDFGSLYCRPMPSKNSQPRLCLDACDLCVFRDECRAFALGKVSLLPVKKKPLPVRTRYFYYFFVRWSAGDALFFILRQRKNKDIWMNLFEFPLLESEHELDEASLSVACDNFISGLGSPHAILHSVSQPFVHKLTHQTLVARFITIDCGSSQPHCSDDDITVSSHLLNGYPVSRLIDRFLASQ